MAYMEIDMTQPDAIGLRLKQADAMLQLFAVDRGRAPLTLDEIREWAYAQDDNQLQVRVNQFLSESF
jgi:hypothetical protein